MSEDLYSAVLKRRSFHVFPKLERKLTLDEVVEIQQHIQTLVPLDPEIRTEITIVANNRTTLVRGQEYCIVMYSERKDGYLQNLGYLGEQLDLWLTSKGIGVLWSGLGSAKEKKEGLEYVIMLAIGKMEEDRFRSDLSKVSRKAVTEIWSDELYTGIRDVVRYAPSAINMQPWYVQASEEQLTVYRRKETFKPKLLSDEMQIHYNQMDMGIFLYTLEVCLAHEGIRYERAMYMDDGAVREKTLVAEYLLTKMPK